MCGTTCRVWLTLLKDANSDALLVVDAITGLGTTHFDVDGWGVDVMIGGSQKAVMIPPGLSYLSVSQRAWEAMEISLNPRYYFDLRKERKNAKKGESAYTPAVALIAALGAALDYIAAQGGGDLAAGRKALVDNAETCAAMTRAAVEALGLKLVRARCTCGCGYRCSAACWRRFRRIREGIEEPLCCRNHQRTRRDEGADLPHRAHRLLRLTWTRSRLIGALEQVAASSLKLPGFEFGKALAAAQKVYASSGLRKAASGKTASSLPHDEDAPPLERASARKRCLFTTTRIAAT